MKTTRFNPVTPIQEALRRMIEDMPLDEFRAWLIRGDRTHEEHLSTVAYIGQKMAEWGMADREAICGEVLDAIRECTPDKGDYKAWMEGY